MTRFRVRIGTLVIVMVVLAFMLAALREATPLWNELAFSATWLILMTAALLAVHRSGESRAFWIGFATWGIGYLVTTASGLESRLFTTRVLQVLDQSLPGREEMLDANIMGNAASVTLSGASGTLTTPTLTINSGGRIRIWNATTGRLLRGAGSSTENFLGIGHSFLALLVGYVGGWLSRRLGQRGTIPGATTGDPCSKPNPWEHGS